MGYFIQGLNGDCNPKADYWQSVKYYNLSCALDDAYGIIDAFDLQFIQEAGVLPMTASSTTEEEKHQADNLMTSYTTMKEQGYRSLWIKKIWILAHADDVQTLCLNLIEKDKEEDRLASIELDERNIVAQKQWDSLTQEEKTLAEEIYQWEQSHWANAFEYEDSPYLKIPEFRDKYNLAYDWMKENILLESW